MQGHSTGVDFLIDISKVPAIYRPLLLGTLLNQTCSHREVPTSWCQLFDLLQLRRTQRAFVRFVLRGGFSFLLAGLGVVIGVHFSFLDFIGGERGE
jgi:hypothetical protein